MPQAPLDGELAKGSEQSHERPALRQCLEGAFDSQQLSGSGTKLKKGLHIEKHAGVPPASHRRRDRGAVAKW